MLRPLEITVGGSIVKNGVIIAPAPAAGQTDCLIPSLKGYDIVIWQRGLGTKLSSEYTVLSDGGFRLLGGDLFVASDIWFVLPSGTYSSPDQETTYTNGYDYSRVITALSSRLGWRPSTIAGAPVLTADNMVSKSGRYFNDFHTICTVQMVRMIMEDPAASDADINTFLVGLARGAILQALNGVINEPEQLELRLEFDRYGEQNDRPIANQNLFVGRRITIAKLEDIAVQIDSVGLYFDADVTFPIYLFREGRKQPIWSMDVTVEANEKLVQPLADVILGYMGSNNLGGAYYFGYFQADLGNARAIDESRIGYNTANNWRIDLVQSKQTAGLEFDRKIIPGSPWSNGLQLQLSAFKDWTTLIVKKANLFDELIGLQMAAKIIELALNNVRSNADERGLKDNLIRMGLYQALDGTVPGVPDAPRIDGLSRRITREVTRVKKSFILQNRAISYNLGYDCHD